ncbi:MAG: 30S ribosomal protein S4 [Candidatus Krumholzibacteriota bacterium]|nr:30S ribosomal protein S4 [Candidatus Krumholzibacteriota bacterium]
MARYLDAKCKLCRREGDKLFLKGERCFSDRCAMEKRPYPPGQHGRSRRRKVSEYGTQLREKQKLRRIYGVLEKPFRNYFAEAARRKGVTGTNLLQLLECRLDNVVYRLGFAPSRDMARQLVNHRHFEVNDHVVDIPSFQVKPGDKVTLRARSRKNPLILDSMKNATARGRVGYVTIEDGKFDGQLTTVPERELIPINVQEQLIVELYSK